MTYSANAVRPMDKSAMVRARVRAAASPVCVWSFCSSLQFTIITACCIAFPQRISCRDIYTCIPVFKSCRIPNRIHDTIYRARGITIISRVVEAPLCRYIYKQAVPFCGEEGISVVVTSNVVYLSIALHKISSIFSIGSNNCSCCSNQFL